MGMTMAGQRLTDTGHWRVAIRDEDGSVKEVTVAGGVLEIVDGALVMRDRDGRLAGAFGPSVWLEVRPRG